MVEYDVPVNWAPHCARTRHPSAILLTVTQKYEKICFAWKIASSLHSIWSCGEDKTGILLQCTQWLQLFVTPVHTFNIQLQIPPQIHTHTSWICTSLAHEPPNVRSDQNSGECCHISDQLSCIIRRQQQIQPSETGRRCRFQAECCDHFKPYQDWDSLTVWRGVKVVAAIAQ